MSTVPEEPGSFGGSDQARVEAYVSALQFKYPQIDGNESLVLKANKLREKSLLDLIEKQRESLRCDSPHTLRFLWMLTLLDRILN